MSVKKLVVCVCRGNILRSAIAEKLINRQLAVHGLDSQYEVISRSIQGTALDTKPVRYPNLTYYSSVYQKVKPVLDELKVDLTQHVSTAIDRDTASKAVHVFAMDRLTKSALETLFPDISSKIFLFSDLAKREEDIADVPCYTKPTYSVKTIRDIQSILDNGLQSFLTLINNPKLSP